MLLPSWPWSLRPQQSTPPPESRAQAWLAPAVIELTPVSVPLPPTPTTASRGRVSVVVGVPIPSCPAWLWPQQRPSAARDAGAGELAVGGRLALTPVRKPLRHSSHLHRYGAVGGRVVAELAVVVQAPAPNGAVATRAAQVWYLPALIWVTFVSPLTMTGFELLVSRVSVAQLAAVVAAPALDRAVDRPHRCGRRRR